MQKWLGVEILPQGALRNYKIPNDLIFQTQLWAMYF